MSKETKALNKQNKQRWWQTFFGAAATVAAGDSLSEADKLDAQAQVLENEAAALRARAAAARTAALKSGA